MDRLTRRQRSALFLFAYTVGLILIIRDVQAGQWAEALLGVAMVVAGVAIMFGRPRLHRQPLSRR